MKGLLLKDFLVLREVGKQFGIIFVIFAICDFLSEGNMGFCRSFSIVAALITCVNTMSYDEYYHWDAYAFTLPVARRTIVQTKYCLAGLLTAAIFLLLFILEVVLYGKGIDDALVTNVILYAYMILCLALTIPLVYRFGPKKALLAVAGAAGAIVAIVMTLGMSYAKLVGSETLIGLLNGLFANLPLLIGGVIIFLAVVVYFSYSYSVKLVEKKVF